MSTVITIHYNICSIVLLLLYLLLLLVLYITLQLPALRWHICALLWYIYILVHKVIKSHLMKASHANLFGRLIRSIFKFSHCFPIFKWQTELFEKFISAFNCLYCRSSDKSLLCTAIFRTQYIQQPYLWLKCIEMLIKHSWDINHLHCTLCAA